MKKISVVLFLFFAACLFIPSKTFAQKPSKKDKMAESASGESSAVAVVPESKKKPKKSNGFQPKINVPDTSGEDMPVPEPLGLISDFGNLFSPGQEDTLNAMIKTFKDSSQDEIAIIAWDTLHLVPEDFDGYVKKIGEEWEIGEKDKGNGVIIAFSVQLRKIKIVNITGGLNDKDAFDIVHKILLPYFMQKNYYPGTILALQAVMKKLIDTQE